VDYVGEMRQAEERCAIVEMEVREEVSSQMAALMKEAETRLREVYTKSADVSCDDDRQQVTVFLGSLHVCA
jgi:hypothetical protein